MRVGAGRSADTVSGSPRSPEPSTIPPRPPDGLTASSMAGDTRNSWAMPRSPPCASSSRLEPDLFPLMPVPRKLGAGHPAASFLGGRAVFDDSLRKLRSCPGSQGKRGGQAGDLQAAQRGQGDAEAVRDAGQAFVGVLQLAGS